MLGETGLSEEPTFDQILVLVEDRERERAEEKKRVFCFKSKSSFLETRSHSVPSFPCREERAIFEPKVQADLRRIWNEKEGKGEPEAKRPRKEGKAKNGAEAGQTFLQGVRESANTS